MYETPPPRLGATRDTSRGRRFGDLLATARRARGLTQDDVMWRSGVARRTIARWEAGHASTPKPEHVRAVCNALGIDQCDALVALGYLTVDELTAAA